MMAAGIGVVATVSLAGVALGRSHAARSLVAIQATATFKGKKGTLTLAFRGVGIAVTTSTTDSQYEVEYGTWTVSTGDGMYKGWRGGGRWANASVPAASHIEWDGYASH